MLLIVPYQGKKQDYNLNSFRKGMIKMLPNNVKPQIPIAGRKLSTSFQIKDKTEMKHNHDVIYYNEFPEEQCNENYLGKMGRRAIKRVINHARRDSKSSIYKNSIATGHSFPDMNDLKMIDRNFRKECI